MTMTRITEYQFWARVIRMAAAIIGASAALWWLSGDRDPEAAALSDAYVQSVTIQSHNSADFRNISFFQFYTGTGHFAEQSGAGWVCSGDDDLQIAKWLTEHDGQRVLWSLQAASTLRKDGNVK